MKRRSITRGCALSVCALLPLSCGDEGAGQAAASDQITLYTCVSDTTIQPVLEAFEEANPGSEVELFRAPTGELNSRVAGDIRSGGLKADVIWACDPLTMQGYVEQDLVGGWTPDDAAAIPAQFRTDDYVGAAVLYMLAIHHRDAGAPQVWSDLTEAEYADGVALPDPSFAASALGAVGYFAQADGYGLAYFAELEQNGAVQVSTPDEVTVAVAQGVYQAGVTIANSAYAAKEDGSPVDVVWPEPGAVAIYGPVAPTRQGADSELAQEFASFVISEEGQEVIGKAGSYPTMEGAPSPTLPADAPVVYPDWTAIGADKDKLLSEYRQIFGG